MVKNRHLEAVKLLLRKGFDINAKNNQGQTALTLAVESRHKVVLELLLEEGTNVEIKKQVQAHYALCSV